MFSHQATVHSLILRSTQAQIYTLTAGQRCYLLLCLPAAVLTQVEIQLLQNMFYSLPSLRWFGDGHRHWVFLPHLWIVSAHLCCIRTGSSWWQFSTLHWGEKWMCVCCVWVIYLRKGACILKFSGLACHLWGASIEHREICAALEPGNQHSRLNTSLMLLSFQS